MSIITGCPKKSFRLCVGGLLRGQGQREQQGGQDSGAVHRDSSQESGAGG